MTIDILPETYRRMLATHAALGKLGFVPDVIFAVFAPAADDGGIVHGFVQIGRDPAAFAVDCGAAVVDHHPMWRAAVTLWNRMSQAERDAQYRRVYTATGLILMDAALRARGVAPPWSATDPAPPTPAVA